MAHRGLVRMRHIIVGAFALGVTMLLLAFVPGVGFAVPAVFLVGMASILYLTATTAIVQVEARPEMHGRVLSLQTVLLGSRGPSAVPSGWLADALGGRVPIVVGGVVCLLAAASATMQPDATHRAPAETAVDHPPGRPSSAYSGMPSRAPCPSPPGWEPCPRPVRTLPWRSPGPCS